MPNQQSLSCYCSPPLPPTAVNQGHCHVLHVLVVSLVNNKSFCSLVLTRLQVVIELFLMESLWWSWRAVDAVNRRLEGLGEQWTLSAHGRRFYAEQSAVTKWEVNIRLDLLTNSLLFMLECSPEFPQGSLREGLPGAPPAIGWRVINQMDPLSEILKGLN